MNNKKWNVYIYGAGDMYNKLCSYLLLYEENLNILGIVTSTKPLYAYIDNHPCYSVDEVDFEQADFIIIAVDKWEGVWEILKQRGEGLEEKIIISRIFGLPGFDLNEYIELKKSNISILANDCVGGLVYKKLGLKYLSPTVNMRCPGNGYIEFLENYEYYLGCVMQKIEEETYIDGTYGSEVFAPKVMLDGRIKWYLSRYINAEQAIEKWDVRKKRFNLENVAVIMTISCDEDAYRFEKLNIEKRVGIYHKDLHLEHVIYCPEWNDDESLRFHVGNSWEDFVVAYMVNQSMRCMAPINWIKFLLGKKDYRRKVIL